MTALDIFHLNTLKHVHTYILLGLGGKDNFCYQYHTSRDSSLWN